MKIVFILLPLLGYFSLQSYCQSNLPGPVDEQVINTVIEIRKNKEQGSGFLVSMGDKRLLVTNKHMIGDWSPVDPFVINDSIYIYPYSVINNKSSFLKVGIKIADHGHSLGSKVEVHSNHKIDIAIIDITSDIRNLSIDN